MVTGFAILSADGWKRDTNWIPVPLTWALDEIHSTAGTPTEDRELVPERPYWFNLGFSGTGHPDLFKILTLVAPTGQVNEFASGVFCFEVQAFSENADPDIRWYRVRWNGGFTGEENEIQLAAKLQIEESKEAPWTTQASRAVVDS
jgi:hypothetical protein